MPKKVIITSGYFNPLHIGHINLFKGAKNLGDYLIVIVNNDKQVKLKRSEPFLKEQERVEIIKALKYVDEVFLSIDLDESVSKTLFAIAEFRKEELFFANGGDRRADNIPEREICKKLNIKTIDGVGGPKVQSSSWILKNKYANKN